ncbi:MAG: Ig-like domain-containing protein [Bacteroidetes bacterium]|nr:Ig-like domain-containing protein [Bacteroidota bacterium]
MARKVVFVITLIVCSCADPRPPNGGPRDELPPSIVSTEPPNETVNTSPSEIRINFSEFVNEGSFARALSIVPDPLGRLSFRWRRRSVTIRLSEELRDSTTYVITLSDEFRDWRGVRLQRPLSFAFSTGPVIDQGQLRGRVIDAVQGIPVAGLTILAYPANASFSDPPAYQTQTDSDGKFDIRYVRESDFVVIGLTDLNRNLSPDPQEWFAIAPQRIMSATSDTSGPYLDWIYTQLDTLRPKIERVRAMTNQLLDIRLSEDVTLTDLSRDAWEISDSVSHAPITVYSSYQLISNPRSIFLTVDPLKETIYSLIPSSSVQDSSGNSILTDTVYFNGSNNIADNIPKFIEFLTKNEETPYQLAPWENPELVFNQPIERKLLDSLVTVVDSTGTPTNFEIQTPNGTTYLLADLIEPAQIYQVSVQQPDSTYTRLFERLGPRSLGTLSGVTLPFGDTVLVALTDENGKIISMQRSDSLGHFSFHQLPEARYQLRAFIDQNQNGQWDGGQIHPYQAPEPITWVNDPFTIRPRWDTELPDTLRIRTPSFSPNFDL